MQWAHGYPLMVLQVGKVAMESLPLQGLLQVAVVPATVAPGPVVEKCF